ncbi:hypothetical protein [Rubellicoccus peritrichatus]|uniref:Outer membrane lipoprotein-sorting protein n=1 Tax=Rubellicoccus peritrichatus TaxID=3080537 RepID=A0AAQ3LGR2_9BACT|nr:hypothetical protein [Puniceicoccus sp. CR14]WOO43513.1 hypothetical protein RZN69_10480 [Puniceicoccus sp. CR14]
MNKIALTIIASIITFGLQAETVDQVIEQARAYLGSEKALKSVNTIQYKGRVIDADGTESGKIFLQFKRPNLQRLELDSASNVETTGVNGFEGWRERIDKENPMRSGVMVLPPTQVQYLIANARENLNFFDGPKTTPGGKIELEGSEKIRGKDGWKVLFQYPGGLTYTRFFDKKTGALIATESGTPNQDAATLPTMVEDGAMEVSGIKFPKEVKTYNGDELVRSVVFDEIKVNDPIDDSIFDFPAIPSRIPTTKP